MPILMSLMTNGSTVMPNTSILWLGPNGTTAKPIRAGPCEDRREAEHELVRTGRHDVFFEEQFQAVGDRLEDAIGTNFHGPHAVLHPAEHFPFGEGQDHHRQHDHAHDGGDLGQRNCESQAEFSHENIFFALCTTGALQSAASHLLAGLDDRNRCRSKCRHLCERVERAVKQCRGSLRKVVGEPHRSRWDPFHEFDGRHQVASTVRHPDAITIGDTQSPGLGPVHSQHRLSFEFEQSLRTSRQLPRMKQALRQAHVPGGPVSLRPTRGQSIASGDSWR